MKFPPAAAGTRKPFSLDRRQNTEILLDQFVKLQNGPVIDLL